MTDQPPPDDSAGETGWEEQSLDPPRLYPVPDPESGRAGDAGGEVSGAVDGVEWSNTADELLVAVLEQVDQLADKVGDLDKLVNADRDDDAGAGPGKHRPYRYERRTPDQAASTHAELTHWVSWLVTTYQLTDIVPPCWDRHDALAEELAGFYVAWQNVWTDDGRDDAAVGWHDQLHRAVSGRWAAWLRGARCTENCALDADFLDQTVRRWSEQSKQADGADYRLDRTRRYPPPIPSRTRKTQPRPTAAQTPPTPLTSRRNGR